MSLTDALPEYALTLRKSQCCIAEFRHALNATPGLDYALHRLCASSQGKPTNTRFTVWDKCSSARITDPLEFQITSIRD